MLNAERILGTLDQGLDHEVPLVICGRAAIALGFESPPDPVTVEQLEHALAEAVIPDLVALRDAFERAKPLVRELARELAGED